MHALYSSMPNACASQYVDLNAKTQCPPEADFNVQQCIDVKATQTISPCIPGIASSANSVDELIANLSCFTSEQVKLLEEHTRGQSKNSDWKSQHVGRITASIIIHRVKTKVNSLNKETSTASTIPLVKLLTGQAPQLSSECIPSLQYGQQMEVEACAKYENEMKLGGSKDIKVQCCGLFVLQDKLYIGASPDGLVSWSCCGEGLLEIECLFGVANQSPPG